MGEVSSSVELNESWGSFSWGGLLNLDWWVGNILGSLFGLGSIVQNFLDWSWCFDVEISILNNMVWHVGGPGLCWGIEWESLLSIVFSFPGGMSISNFSSGGGLEVSIVFFDMEDMSFVCLEGSSLSLSFSSFVHFHSSLKVLNHILGGFLGLGSII